MNHIDLRPVDTSHPMFEPIWRAIKGWNIQREAGCGYAGATGTDVQIIIDSLAAAPHPEAGLAGLPSREEVEATLPAMPAYDYHFQGAAFNAYSRRALHDFGVAAAQAYALRSRRAAPVAGLRAFERDALERVLDLAWKCAEGSKVDADITTVRTALRRQAQDENVRRLATPAGVSEALPLAEGDREELQRYREFHLRISNMLTGIEIANDAIEARAALGQQATAGEGNG